MIEQYLLHSFDMKVDEKTEKEVSVDTAFVEQMFEVGAHFGYKRSSRHPSVSPFIFGLKNRVEIFDLEKTSTLVDNAKAYMETLGSDGKTILFVGGKNEAQKVVREGADALEMPYVNGRWIGGTLTNFSEIKKRIERLNSLKEQKEKGELESKYTKKERLMIDREIESLEKTFGGLADMTVLPHALFVVDTKREHTAVAEAKNKNIPVVGLLNSDCDMSGIEHPIVANDATQKSIEFFVTEMVDAYKRGMQKKAEQKETK